MKYLYLFILIIFNLSVVISVENVNLDKAIELALKNNISLKRAGLEQVGKKKSLSSAYNVFYPQVNGSASVLRSNTDPETYSDTNLSIGYDASLTFTPALFDAITILKKNYELGSISYEKIKADLEVKVKEIFYNLILLKEQVSLLDGNLKTIEKRYNLTELNFQAGLVSELDLLQVQVSYENFKPELNNLNNIYTSTLLSFKSLLGIPLDTEIYIDGKINPDVRAFNADELYNYAIEGNKDLKSINKMRELFTAQKKAKFSQSFLPVFNVSYSSRTSLNDPFNSDVYDIDNFTDDSGSFTFSLLYSFHSLFPNSAERVEIDTIERSLLDVGYQEAMLQENLKLQIVNSVSMINNSIKIQKGLELTVVLAKKSLDKIQQSYNAGSSQLLEVENSENEYKKASLELLKEKYKYINSVLQLESICAQKLF